MKIALVGRGKMGRAIAQAVEGSDHLIEMYCSSEGPPESRQQSLLACDIILDFSLPSVALDHIHLYTQLGIPSVVGVTGWYDDLALVEDWVTNRGSHLLYSANFSSGIALFKKMIGHLSEHDLRSFHLSIDEIHHTEKVDQPSGTAIELSNRIDGEVAVHSERVGDIKGIHTLQFKGYGESLEIRHAVDDRQVFAHGAVRAAEWLLTQEPGLYTFDDVFSHAAVISEQINQ